MASDRFRQSLLFQQALIIANCLVLAWLVVATSYTIPTGLCIAALIIQVIVLIRYLDHTNRTLARFLVTIRQRDFAQNFVDPDAPASVQALGTAMQDVIASLQQARTEKEEQASYLDVLVRHIPVAVIAMDETGKVTLYNNAARRLFGINNMTQVENLRQFDPDLADAVITIGPGEEQLVKVLSENKLFRLSIGATALRLGGRELKIVSVQDIQQSLESQESEAWQNLIRVLNHEIMNSMTPITSLAQTGRRNVEDLMAGLEQDNPSLEALQDIRDALEAMGNRGAGLMRFVDSYRSLASLPQVNARPFRLDAFVDRIHRLMASDFQAAGVSWVSNTHPVSLELNGDAQLLEQAVINLLKNARESLAGRTEPAVSLTAKLGDKGKVIIAISDNGCGMDEETLGNIFVPFYTTKRGGTGVGMNLVRRIVRLQGGQVHVQSEPGKGSSMRLVF